PRSRHSHRAHATPGPGRHPPPMRAHAHQPPRAHAPGGAVPALPGVAHRSGASMTDPLQPAPARAEPGAYSANIYYYAENKDALLLDCVQPLTLELGPRLRHVYFLRHWLRGPHVKLCLAGDAAAVRELIYPRVRAAVERYL